MSVRQGLVVTEVRCVRSASVVAVVGAAGRGGDESGVYAVGQEDVESWVSVVWGRPGSLVRLGAACVGGPLVGTLAK